MKQPVLTIAIADDTQFMRVALTKFLCSIDYHVCLSSPNGRELIEGIRMMDDPPHLCIVDVNMKPINGFQTTKAIKLLNNDIKVIGYSFDSEPKVEAEMRKAGADGFFVKGHPLEILVELIAQLFRDHVVILSKTSNGFLYKKLTEND